MWHPRLLGELRCAAASGLVADETALYVVADDCTRLHIYARGTLAEAPSVVLLPDTLPADPRGRKAAKPDLEMLTRLPDGRLLALGSGSTLRRARGVLIPLPADPDTLSVHDVAPLYAALSAEFTELNLEGAAVTGAFLRLLQRGNGSVATNAVIDLELAGVLDTLARGRPWPADLVRHTRRLDLGHLPGGPLGFTDAATLPEGDVLFTAVAEGGGSTYEDGDFGGAALGRLDADGRLQWLTPLEGPWKIEGLSVTARDDGGLELLMVADADDPTVPAPLLGLSLTAAQALHGR